MIFTALAERLGIVPDRVSPSPSPRADYRNRLLVKRAETPPAQLIRQDCWINGFQQARAQRRMNAESGVDDLLGVLGHTSLSFSLAKSPRREKARQI